MVNFRMIGKGITVLGAILMILGLFTTYADRLFPNFHGLPGDIVIKRKNFTVYFPVVSSLVVSLILSAIFWFIHKK